jgi:hypothetical protein
VSIDKEKAAKVTAVVMLVYELGQRIVDRIRARRAKRAAKRAMREIASEEDERRG